MTSKIINMAERLKDAEDRLLESIFRAEPIADDGFSRRVVRKIRRRIWVQRLALPVAILVGGAVAIKPASELVLAASKLLAVVPQGLVDAPASWMPEIQGVAVSGSLVQALVFGAILAAAGLVGSRLLFD